MDFNGPNVNDESAWQIRARLIPDFAAQELSSDYFRPPANAYAYALSASHDAMTHAHQEFSICRTNNYVGGH
jgi:hypothetical protein